MDRLVGKLLFGKTSPVRSVPIGPFQGKHESRPFWFDVSGGHRLEGWLSEPKAAPSQGVLIYFGGRNENVAWTQWMGEHIGDWSICACNHRSMGRSTGMPTERTVKHDARALADWVVSTRPQAGRVAVMGRSLGTAVALHAAQHVRASDVVLVSPFTHLADVLKMRTARGIWRRRVESMMNCSADAQAIHGRTLAVVAEHDQRISRAVSMALVQQLAGARQVVDVPGTDHRTVLRDARTLQAVGRFLAGGL